MVTVQLLVENNSKTIRRTLDSISDLDPEIYVADLDCSDNTVEICNEYGATVFRPQSKLDLGDIRNSMVLKSSHNWNMVIEPWEVIPDCDILTDAMKVGGKAYNLSIVQGGIITKETRLWDKRLQYKFVNPVYEYLDTNYKDDNLHCMVYSGGCQRDNAQRLSEWRQRHPSASEVLYYQACYHLSNGEWERFMTLIEQFLFGQQKTSMSVILGKYYYALVLCHMRKSDATKAVKNVLECIAVQPTMAEFWCLLGDIHYHLMKDYRKALHFYDNAIILGTRRLSSSIWPMEISKYKDYPVKMIESCQKLLSCDPVLVSQKRL